MKYIVLKRTWHHFTQECPIIFPEEFTHPEVFYAITEGIADMKDVALVSAGFINILNEPHCFGVSGGLNNLASRGTVDSYRIREYINDRGIVD